MKNFKFIPPCMFIQDQYTMSSMPQAFQGVMEEDFLECPVSVSGYPTNNINWNMIPPELPMYTYDMPIKAQMPPMQAPMQMPVQIPIPMSIPMPSCGMSMPTFTPTHVSASAPSPIDPCDLQMALELIKEALAGETEDKLFYEYLISTAPSEEDKNVIKGIRDNEIKHFGMFRELYKDLTGEMPPSVAQEEFVKPSSYCEGLKMAIMGEQRAVEKYRKILSVLTNRKHINKMVEIITDELRHGTLYNYLYSKNKCTK